MKTPEERGPIGAWAYNARADADLSVEQAADRLRLRGISAHPATIRGIESGGKKPGRLLLRGLADVYGVHPPTLPDPVPLEGIPELVAATREQTAAIERQTAAIDGLLALLSGGASRVEIQPEVEIEIAEADF